MPIASVLKGLLHKHNDRQQPAPHPAQTHGTAPTASAPPASAPHSSPPSQAASSDVNHNIAQPPAAHLAPASAKSSPVTASTNTNASAPTGQAMAASNAGQTSPAAGANAGGNSTHAQAENLVRKEAEAKAKRDQSVFDGLPDGLTLGRKMGDGAFSNVFEAAYRPSPAQLAVDPKLAKEVKVAVKCVRKFELNSTQVRTFAPSRSCALVFFFSRFQSLVITARATPRHPSAGLFPLLFADRSNHGTAESDPPMATAQPGLSRRPAPSSHPPLPSTSTPSPPLSRQPTRLLPAASFLLTDLPHSPTHPPRFLAFDRLAATAGLLAAVMTSSRVSWTDPP